MAIQTSQAQRADAPDSRLAGRTGLFGTGAALPLEADIHGPVPGPARRLDPALAVGLVIGVLDVEHVPVVPAVTSAAAPSAAAPRRAGSRWRGLGQRLRTWGAGPDGAHLAWRAAPLPVYQLGTGAAPAVARTAPAAPAPVAVPTPVAVPVVAARPVEGPVDHELEAAIEFATDFSIDLLHSRVRLAAPKPRLTAPLRGVLAGVRGVASAAASWGAGTHGANLSWDRPVRPAEYGLTLPPLPAPRDSGTHLRQSGTHLDRQSVV